MLSLLIAAATAAAPPPLDAQARCVAVLAVVATEQQRGVAEANDAWPPLADDGARFAAAVEKAGAGREAVLAQIAALQREAQGASALPDRALVESCVAMMHAVAPPPPPPALPYCAALLATLRDDVRAREGLTAEAKDLATLASVLDYRAREELRGGGKGAGERDRAMAAAREGLKLEAVGQDELDRCVELAAP